MGRVGVSITKSTVFRNSVQEFSNVYYYEKLDGGFPGITDAASLIDNLTTLEKTWHATTVTFVRGRCWSQVGSPATNEMIEQHNLSGTGALTQDSTWDKERAFLVRIRAGNDSRGNPVYLRKWYHSMGPPSGVTVGTSQMNNSSSMTQASRDALVALFDDILLRTVAGSNYELRAKSGRAFNTPAIMSAHAFLEHHQLGDQWRAQ